jgi:oxalate decarboxylase/phosphoglucose isomerase-like protein (cupin superfamily)
MDGELRGGTEPPFTEGIMTNSFKFAASEPQRFRGGTLQRASLKNFGVLKGLAIQALHLEGGVVREPHVHPNAHQLDYCVSGRARVGIVGPEGHKQYLDLEPGDISFVPQGYLHWIENRGKDRLDFLVILSHEEPETIELSEMLRGVSGDTLAKLFGVAPDAFASIPETGIKIGGHGMM